MAKRTVKLLGEGIYNENDKAAEAITPGHLVNFNSSGDLIKHASAAGRAAKTFALEREEMGDDIDDNYAIGDTVKVGHFGPGCIVYALVASGQNLIKGDPLESAGNGTLKEGTTNVIARSLDAPGAISVLTRVRAEIV
jgi:hypothetical protein